MTLCIQYKEKAKKPPKNTKTVLGKSISISYFTIMFGMEMCNDYLEKYCESNNACDMHVASVHLPED